MKIISTKVHACLDYACAIVMICSPLLFQLSSQEYYILFLTGIFTLLYSLLTHYEFGAIHILSMPTHFKLDLLSGLLLVFVPWFFSISVIAFTAFLSVGAIKVMLSLFSYSHIAPSRKYTGTFHKVYDMPMYGKMEKFPRMKL